MTNSDMNTDNYIYKYYQQICDGTVTVGKWIRLLYEYLIRGFEEKLFFFDQKKANDAIEWVEKHCFHTEGPLGGKSYKLELWQKAMRSAMFGILDADGNRQFREILLLVGRKNGKSLDASSTGKYVWQSGEGGYGARIFCLAPKLEQANIIYDNIWAMTQLDPEWQALKELVAEKDDHNKRIHDDSELARHRMTDLFIPATNSTVKKIAFSAKKSDGFNPSLCICDEVAAWEGDKGLKQYEVMASAMGARPDGMLLSCTTSGYVNDSIFDDLMKRSTRFLLGDSRETTLLPFLYMIDDVEKWNDINELRKANPNLGVSIPVKYMLNEIAKAEQTLSKKAEFMTKYCCIKQNSSTAFLSTQDVEAMCGEPLKLEDFRENYCVVGIDLSQTTDLTAACAVIEKNEELYVFCQFFMPSEKLEEATARDSVPYPIYVKRGLLTLSGGNFVDYHDVEDWLVSLVSDMHIYPLICGYDRYSAQYLVNDLEMKGFHCSSVYQGDNLWPVIQECEGLIKDRKIHIGDNDLLKMHLLNSAVKMSVERGRGRLVKIAPTLHVDGMACLLDALCVRQANYAEMGDRLRND